MAKDDITRELERLASSDVEDELQRMKASAGRRAVGAQQAIEGVGQPPVAQPGPNQTYAAAADRPAAAQPGGPAMIVRILSEGQWRIEKGHRPDSTPWTTRSRPPCRRATRPSGRGPAAVARSGPAVGVVVPDEELADSDLILPDVDASLDEVRALLSESDEGLIPNWPRRSGWAGAEPPGGAGLPPRVGRTPAQTVLAWTLVGGAERSSSSPAPRPLRTWRKRTRWPTSSSTRRPRRPWTVSPRTRASGRRCPRAGR